MENLKTLIQKTKLPPSSHENNVFVPMMTLICPGLLHALHLLAYFLQELVTTTNIYIYILKKMNERMLFK